MQSETGDDLKLIRGRVFTFVRAPMSVNDSECFAYWENGGVVVQNGIIQWRGDVADLPEAYNNLPTENHDPNLILPGFLDAHTHYPQMEVVGSYGEELMPWLNNYTFPQEMRIADKKVTQNSFVRFPHIHA